MPYHRIFLAGLACLALALPAHAQPSPSQAAALDSIDANAGQFTAAAPTQAGAIKQQTAAIRAILTPVVVTPPPPPPPSGRAAVGIAVPDNSAAASIDAFTAWYGQPPAYSYMNSASGSWSGQISSMQGCFAGGYASCAPAKARGIKPYWTIPILVKGATYAKAATGAYDANWRAVAQLLVNTYGTAGEIIVRPNAEFNGTWFTDFLVQAGQEPLFVQAWQREVTVFRSVCACFRFDYNMSINYGVTSGKAALDQQSKVTPPNVVAAYPGDAFVDYIGFDVYFDNGWNSVTDNWNWLLNGYGASPSLKWLATFAAQHGKPITIPEWGTTDDAKGRAWLALWAPWVKANNVVLQQVWNRGDGYPGQMNTSQTRAAYKAAFAQ